MNLAIWDNTDSYITYIFFNIQCFFLAVHAFDYDVVIINIPDITFTNGWCNQISGNIMC